MQLSGASPCASRGGVRCGARKSSQRRAAPPRCGAQPRRATGAASSQRAGTSATASEAAATAFPRAAQFSGVVASERLETAREQVLRVRALVRGFDALLPFDPGFNAAVALWREIAATPEEHRGMLLDALDEFDVARTWSLAGRRYLCSASALEGALGIAPHALLTLPPSESSPPGRRDGGRRSAQGGWHLYTVAVPSLPAPLRRCRAQVFPLCGASAGALGGRVAPGAGGAASALRSGPLAALLAAAAPPLHFSIEAAEALPASGDPVDAALDFGARGGHPPLLAEELPSGAAAAAAAARLGVALRPVRAPRWPVAGVRAYLRAAGPGLLVGSAWGGDGQAALERPEAEADEPLFTFLMLRVAATDEEPEPEPEPAATASD